MFRLTFGLLCCSLITVVAAPPEASRPNVLIMLADDQGWADIGYNNPRVYSPHLDALAKDSVLLVNHYAMPQCTPSRVALLTGRFPGRFGPQATQATILPAFPIGTPTLAETLRGAGYATHLVGKWHLGSRFDHGPWHFGFEHSYGSMSGGVGVYDHRYRTGEYEETWQRDGAIIPGYENGVHVTELMTREAVRIIESASDQPFFIYLAYAAVHTPLDERGAFVDQPTQRDPARPERWRNEDRIPWFNDPAGKIQAEPDPEKRLFLAAVHHLDAAVGEVMAALDRTGQRDHTIVVYASDNGPQVDWLEEAYPDDLMLTDINQPSPLRGRKTDVWEGGIHVPGFIHWPGQLRPREVTEPVHLVDWYPTLLSLAGIEPTAPPAWDGLDLTGLLRKDEALPARDLYWTWNENTDRWALRRGDWKIVHYGRKEPSLATDWRLFNLRTDKREQHDLAARHPEIATVLHERFLVQRAGDAREAYVKP